jgi:hypothetical protein
MILTAPNILGSSELGVSFVELSSMESKTLHVSLGSVGKEIDHMPLLFHYKYEYSLVIGENVFGIRNA